MYGDDGVDVMETKFLDKFKFLERNYNEMSRRAKKLVESGAVEIEPIKAEYKKTLKNAKVAMKKDSSLSSKQAKELVSEPLISKFNPLRHFGAISEKMADSMRNFMK